MSAIEVWLDIVVPVLVTGLLARALWAAVAVEASARWLLAAPAPAHRPADRDGQAPWLVVLLPMLREQTVAAESIAAFTGLDYPAGRAAVVAITTEREHTAHARHRRRLPELAALPTLTAAELRGLFPASRCRPVAETVKAAPRSERLVVLTKLFDAEPSTADIVTTLTAGRPEGLPLVHLHQPDVGGRKPGQLNFALDRLPDVLGPLGWREDAHARDTFVLVYDADAVPDRATLIAFADAVAEHHSSTGRMPALIQQQRLPLLARRPFPRGLAGLLLTGEWIYQLRRSLGIELARVRLHQWLTRSRVPEPARMWLRPMVYAVGCGMAVHLPALRRLSGFPEPMEDLGTGHRLSLLGADLAPSAALVLDEPYTDTTGVTNLHALAFTASARPDRHARAIAHLPGGLSRPARYALILREWADQSAWLLGAPLLAVVVAGAWWAGPLWAGLAVVAVLLHGPVTTARLLTLAPVLHRRVTPPATIGSPPCSAAARPITLVAASPLQPFVRLAGPWRLIWAKTTGRRLGFGKTER
ncbi:hypothetical protein FNQ90_05165 [Streptomyces alkaliphilus]|uniref:Glycosyltransferase n=1 Tax=Streptomyces alkaliphilus TaxID=1472722 RepID=A0A7W3TAY3_9ACTN|nr:hypothetical protein [Streptomyces alkaliphilus]MBB0243513.1 hypothetical protein [Streptomyces alkaliphilus]